jgi:hypothetical protein
MTAFLRINGITASVADGSAKRGRKPIGEVGEAVSGAGYKDVRTYKGRWSGALVLAAAADALAWERLLCGDHDTWSFEGTAGVYSAKGVPLVLGGSVALSSAQYRFGSWSVAIPSTKTVEIDYGTQPPWWDPSVSPWTVGWWQREGSTWFHYLECSDGTRYRNGASSGHTAFWTSSSPKLSYMQSSGGTYYLDDLVVLPFVVPVTWPAEMYAFAAALPDAPRLRADGLLIDNNRAGGATVFGGVDGEAPLVQAHIGGALVANAQQLGFQLAET